VPGRPHPKTTNEETISGKARKVKRNLMPRKGANCFKRAVEVYRCEEGDGGGISSLDGEKALQGGKKIKEVR